MPRTLLSGLVVLLVAAGCTAGGQPRRPPATTLAATAPATTDPTAMLHRPLRLPAVGPGDRCPVTRSHQVEPAFAEVLGDGPAYPTDSAGSWRDGRVEGGWYYAKVLWVASPAHPGPFLVRGGSWTGRAGCASARDRSPPPSCCFPPVGPRTARTAIGSTGRPTAVCEAGAATPTRSTARTATQIIVFRA